MRRHGGDVRGGPGSTEVLPLPEAQPPQRVKGRSSPRDQREVELPSSRDPDAVERTNPVLGSAGRRKRCPRRRRSRRHQTGPPASASVEPQETSLHDPEEREPSQGPEVQSCSFPFVPIKEMMKRAGNSHLLTVLSYPDAGHLIEPPYTPHVSSSAFRTVNTCENFTCLWGGQTVEHSRAQEDAWRKILVFLGENLYGNRSPTSSSHL